MKQLSSSIKQSILTHYTSPYNHDTLSRILLLHGVSVSHRAVEKWKKRWNGIEESLYHRKGGGPPHILTPTEIGKYITQPIRRLNRSHKSVRYNHIAQGVRDNTGKSIHYRTVRLIGKNKLGGRKKRGRKRTAEECKYIHNSKE